MAISLSLESKSGIDLSKEAKNSSMIWSNANGTWQEMKSPWSNPKLTLSRESKSGVSLSLESK